MTYATVFSGIAGWEYGLNQAGWELKWQCEKDEVLRSYLNRYGSACCYQDILTLYEQTPEPVDCLVGSPPCQPFAVSGTSLGIADERHLFPAYLETVRRLKPRWLLLEQVSNVLSNWNGQAFSVYLGGLASLGYDLIWHCIPASTVGAPHERDRVYIIAYANGVRLPRQGACRESLYTTPLPFEEAGGLVDAVQRDALPFVCSRHDGFPKKFCEKVLQALGNAVVPEMAYLIGQAVNQVDAIVQQLDMTD